ncbi:TetR family transcriptional regulator [Microbispora sp. RL4-1S]|uniref:TetR family transcriptional regulator n=1 Tax=Microbispora oryzae TaxID=2806554 RepID=A0A940WIF3_9ACTN|nr:TetR/AcrR family transcriptional regulator [Microbispora oryzae]MBP2703338.1 TetR family transcriptional regulator [Microbispora oryzae]
MRRDELLDAAECLLQEQGSHALTLSAVAERAGVSKGGLLYHFASKDALVKGMVERLIAEFDALIESQRETTFTRAYLAATFEAVESGRLRRWAVVTGAAGDPELLAPLREALARWHREGLRDEPDPPTSQVVRLACEGVWEVATQCPAAVDYATVHRRLLELL